MILHCAGNEMFDSVCKQQRYPQRYIVCHPPIEGVLPTTAALKLTHCYGESGPWLGFAGVPPKANSKFSAQASADP
jgi:hypothetical protein